MNWTELLFEAVEIDDVDLVQESLTHGADIHVIVDGRSILSASLSLEQPEDRCTSVSTVAENRNREIMELLLSAGGKS